MGENKFSCSGGAARETYGIETGRILDACRDRDCFEDTRVFLTSVGEDLIGRTGSVRVKCAEITGSYIGVEPIPFNRGFFGVDIRFFVTCRCEACVPIGCSQEFEGVAVLEKRVVLYGGESGTLVFRSSGKGEYCAIPEPVCCKANVPQATVEVVQPVVLGSRIVTCRDECRCCCCCDDVPAAVTDKLNGVLVDACEHGERYLAVSLGLFSVVRLVREGQLLIEAREYCIPDKECAGPTEEDPCGSFRRMPFPVSEFCGGQTLPTDVGGGSCRCGKG